MILNTQTITALFLAAVGGVLAVATTVVAANGLTAVRGDATATRRDDLEDRGHLLALLMATLTGVRLLAWPHFYFVLKSYIPVLAEFGVMCVFGVTRIQAGLVTTIQGIKPLLLLCLGFWWLLRRLGPPAGPQKLIARQFVLALPIAGLALLDCAVEVSYVLAKKAGRPVTCCTQFLETQGAAGAETASATLPLGWNSSAGLLAACIGLTCAVLVGALYLSRRRPDSPAAPGPILPAGLALLGLAKLALTRLTWLESLAPRVLQLPYHHCLYELLTDTPALGLAAVLTLAGNAGLLWPLGLYPWRRHAPHLVDALQRRLYRLCSVAIASEMLIVTVHMI